MKMGPTNGVWDAISRCTTWWGRHVGLFLTFGVCMMFLSCAIPLSQAASREPNVVMMACVAFIGCLRHHQTSPLPLPNMRASTTIKWSSLFLDD